MIYLLLLKYEININEILNIATIQVRLEVPLVINKDGFKNCFACFGGHNGISLLAL